MKSFAKSASLFWVSAKFKKLCYGTPLHYNVIQNLGPEGKTIVLGSIPSESKHVENIKRATGLQNDESFDLFSFTLPFEEKIAGLKDLLKQDKTVNQRKYRTIDHVVPTLANTVRLVHDMEKSDKKVLYVHCKAGRGRSGFGVLAYKAHQMFKENDENFNNHALLAGEIRKDRLQLSVDSAAKKVAFNRFCNELKKAGDIDALYKKYCGQE